MPSGMQHTIVPRASVLVSFHTPMRTRTPDSRRIRVPHRLAKASGQLSNLLVQLVPISPWLYRSWHRYGSTSPSRLSSHAYSRGISLLVQSRKSWSVSVQRSYHCSLIHNFVMSCSSPKRTLLLWSRLPDCLDIAPTR